MAIELGWNENLATLYLNDILLVEQEVLNLSSGQHGLAAVYSELVQTLDQDYEKEIYINLFSV